MYSLEKILGVLCQEFEQEVVELFSAIKAKHKGQRVSPGSLKKVVGCKDKSAPQAILFNEL